MRARQHRSWRHGWLGLLALALFCAALVGSGPPVAAAAAQAPPQPPPQPGIGQLGGEGPCTVPADLDTAAPPTVYDDPNLSHPGQRVWTIQPSGTGSPRTGGTCNDAQRPVVVLVHGWPILDLLGMPSTPNFYFHTIQNLVSNGNIVVFANYDWTDVLDFTNWADLISDIADVRTNVHDGFVQAVVGRGARMKTSDIGVWGHSLGGGVAVELAKQIWNSGRGRTSFWLGLDGASDVFYRCPGIANPFVPPSPDVYDYGQCTDITFPAAMAAKVRVLVTSYRGDMPAVHLGSWRIYEDMTNLPAGRKWGVVVNNDCSHTPAGGQCTNVDCYNTTTNPYPCFAGFPDTIGQPQAGPIHCPPEAIDCRSGHLVSTIWPDWWEGSLHLRVENQLNWYGVYRNLQALSDCARSGTNCTVNRASMGNWTDGVPATPAEVLS